MMYTNVICLLDFGNIILFLLTIVMHSHEGKELLHRHYSELKKAIAFGVVDDTKAVGVLDQWLIEGRYTEEEALVLSCDLLAAGMDTVSIMCRSTENWEWGLGTRLV